MKFDTATTEIAKQKTSELFTEIQRICSANETNRVSMSPDGTNCTITNDSVSLTVDVSIQDWELSVSEWDYSLNALGKGFQFNPKAKSKTYFVPALSSNCDFGWREKGRTPNSVLSVAELAEWCVSQFRAIEPSYEIGQIRPEWRHNERPFHS